MSEIQEARDVLAKWRDGIEREPWVLEEYGFDALWLSGLGLLTRTDDHRKAGALTVGTAGNPDLLDAIDGLLAIADGPGTAFTDQRVAAERIAAAIIAAEKRMNND